MLLRSHKDLSTREFEHEDNTRFATTHILVHAQLGFDTTVGNYGKPMGNANNIKEVSHWNVIVATNERGAGDGIVQRTTFVFSAPGTDLEYEMLKGSFW
jgi:hypothetical protein